MSKAPTVLVLDDDAAFRYAAGRTLQQGGLDVAYATSGWDALDAFTKAPIDLMLTDIRLGDGIDGFGFARMVRPRRPSLKVLFISAYDVGSNLEFGRVLRKPISNEQLIAEVWAELQNPGPAPDRIDAVVTSQEALQHARIAREEAEQETDPEVRLRHLRLAERYVLLADTLLRIERTWAPGASGSARGSHEAPGD